MWRDGGIVTLVEHEMLHFHGLERAKGSIGAATLEVTKPLRDWFGRLHPVTVALAAALLAWCLLGSVAAWLLARDHGDVLQSARDELMAISTTGAAFVDRELGTLDLVVSLGRQEVAGGQMGIAQLHQWLQRQAAHSAQLESLRTEAIIDPTGRIVQASDPAAVGMDLSDRAYFWVHRDDPSAGMFIDEPLISRTLPHRRIVPISWSLHGPRGEFAGVVAVIASWRPFADVFAKLVTRPLRSVSLIDRDGKVLAVDARYWSDSDLTPEMAPFLAGPDVRLPIVAGTAISDGKLFARADVQGVGLRVVAGAPLEAILRSWRLRIYLTAAVTAVLGLGTGLVFGLLHRYVGTLRFSAADARAAQIRAEAGDRAKAQFLAAMSHEIRTPMTGVLGMADLLSSEELSPRQHSYVQSILTSGRHLLSIINDILDFSRADAGGLVLEQIDFSVEQLLEQTRSIMAPQARERGLGLDFDVDPSAPKVLCGDPTRLRQILVNLIGNGLKFTVKGGVRVRYRYPRDADERPSCRFEVEDSGIGIAPERQAELFRAFMQADLSTTRRYGGSGLGLAICRQLVDAMGGRIGVDSVPGQGSVFWLELPLAPGTAPVVNVVSKVASVQRPLRILVAEDVEINRDLLQATLTAKGHELTMVSNGQEAVVQAAAGTFDVILMDVQMPVMDGIQATRRIRALPTPAGLVPIMALTANVMDAERDRCLQAGMNLVLTKPIVWPDVFDALATVTAGHNPKEQVVPAHDPAPPSAESLLDQDRIDGLGKMAGPVKLAEFLRGAIASAESLFAEIATQRDSPPDLAQAAHRLAGTAPSFGLQRIGSIAREVELCANDGRPIGELIDELEAVVATTRAELERSGYVAGH